MSRRKLRLSRLTFFSGCELVELGADEEAIAREEKLLCETVARLDTLDPPPHPPMAVQTTALAELTAALTELTATPAELTAITSELAALLLDITTREEETLVSDSALEELTEAELEGVSTVVPWLTATEDVCTGLSRSLLPPQALNNSALARVKMASVGRWKQYDVEPTRG
ncbi:MAG TPA: hypothetical protein VN030_12245 [Cellvibrio sp.]|nr:hypothetical protein [Cellvibrio sp.]